MNKITFLLIFCAKLLLIKPQSLLISDDAFDSQYIHPTDTSPAHDETVNIERKNFCMDNDFVEKIIFGLINDDDKVMKKCIDENYDRFLNLTHELDEFVSNKVSTEFLRGTDMINPFVAVRRANVVFKHDYLLRIVHYMDKIESVCMLRTNNTAGRSYLAEQMGERIASGEYEKAANNFRRMESTTLTMSTLKFAMEWNDENIVEKSLRVANILLAADEMKLASTMLVTLFGILLNTNRKTSWGSLIIAEKTRFSIEKLTKMPITNFDYKPTRMKFKFIIVHLPKEIRTLVFDIPRRRKNVCIRNKRFETYLYLRERQRQRMILTGPTSKDSDFLKQSVFRVSFDQNDFSYRMLSNYYNDGFLTHTVNDPKISDKNTPERWYFDPVGDGAFLIRTDSLDKSGRNKFLYLVDSPEERTTPRNVKLLMDIKKDLGRFNGEERWLLEAC